MNCSLAILISWMFLTAARRANKRIKIIIIIIRRIVFNHAGLLEIQTTVWLLVPFFCFDSCFFLYIYLQKWGVSIQIWRYALEPFLFESRIPVHALWDWPRSTCIRSSVCLGLKIFIFYRSRRASLGIIEASFCFSLNTISVKFYV